MIVVFVLLALIILMVLITVHEFGHYLAGKALGFKINEFSIGFGKAIFSKTKKNGEKFSIRIIPLGGYCAFDGEDEKETSPDSFNAQKPWKRLIVQIAGGLFNILFGILLCAILLWSIGYDIKKVATVEENPYGSYLEAGDVIRSVNGERVSILNGNFLNELLAKYSDGDTVELGITRNGQDMKISQQVYEKTNEDGSKTTVLGITITNYRHGFFEGLGRSFEVSLGMAQQVLISFGQLITGKLSIRNLSGPIGTIGQVASLAQQSISYVLILLPLLSINLGVFNLLPIPALDGGRVVFTLIEIIFRKPVPRQIEAKIHFVGIILLLALVIFVDLFNIIV